MPAILMRERLTDHPAAVIDDPFVPSGPFWEPGHAHSHPILRHPEGRIGVVCRHHDDRSLETSTSLHLPRWAEGGAAGSGGNMETLDTVRVTATHVNPIPPRMEYNSHWMSHQPAAQFVSSRTAPEKQLRPFARLLWRRPHCVAAVSGRSPHQAPTRGHLQSLE